MDISLIMRLAGVGIIVTAVCQMLSKAGRAEQATYVSMAGIIVAIMLVVSEIGEQWSPQTAPARQAEMPTKRRGSPAGNTPSTIGMRIPKVPQLVPVANAMKQAAIKITAGRSAVSLPAFAIID